MNDVTREKLASDFKALIIDIEELLKDTANQTGEGVGSLRDLLAKRIEEGRKVLGEQERALRDKADQVRESTETYLRANPWTTVGIAAGVGLALGWVLRRD